MIQKLCIEECGEKADSLRSSGVDMVSVDKQYIRLIKDVLENGEEIETRNSKVKRVDTVLLEFDSTPLVSIRRTAWKQALREWEWFSSGSSNVNDLDITVHHWWQPWADKDGIVKNNYSKQLRRYGEYRFEEYKDSGFDQLEAFVEGIKNHPYSRRNILTTWQAEEMYSKDTPITNCHNTITQAFVDSKGLLSITTYQRSVDLICGVPHNWIQMAAFHLWLAASTNRRIGKLKWIGGDIHIYEQHLELAKKMTSIDWPIETPTLMYTPTAAEFKAEDFSLSSDYKPVLKDRAEMVV